MKKYQLNMTALLMATLSFTACAPKGGNTLENQEAETRETSAAVPVFKDQGHTDSYRQYIQLKDALVASSAGEAKAAAASLAETLKAWDGAAEAAKLAAEIAGSDDLVTQRTAFSSLSATLAELLGASGLSSGAVYLAHCPMAEGNKGAVWLASEEEIRNPYFGEKMMKCGSVQEVIR